MTFMKHPFTSLAATMVLSCASLAAHADVIVPVGSTHQGITFQGATLTWDYSPLLLQYIDSTQLAIQGILPATLPHNRYFDEDLGGFLITSAQLLAPATSIALDGADHIMSLSTSGGSTWIAPKAAGLSSGGQLTITNLSIDFDSKRILASITGNFTGAAEFNTPTNTQGKAGVAGGPITTLDNFHLFNFTSFSGDLSWQDGSFGMAIQEVQLTQNGFGHVVSALRLGSSGINFLKNTVHLGSFSVTPVPEASVTWMVLGGVFSMGLMARARRQGVSP